MAIRLGEHVREGTIDNSEKGLVKGELLLAGDNQSVELELKGNAHLDLAGRVLRFSNPDAVPIEPEIAALLADKQTGFVGDMTVSRRSQFIEYTSEEEGRGDREETTVWKTVLFLEWFGHYSGRVVLEGIDYDWETDEPRWELNDEEIGRQVEQARAAKELHLNFALEMFQETNEEIRAAEQEIDPDASDEFTWERRLQESDRRADAFHALLEEASNPEEMERLADLAFEGGMPSELPPAEGEFDEESWEEERESEDFSGRDIYDPSEKVLGLCGELRRLCKSLISERYDDLIGTVAHGDFLALVVKAQTAADLIDRGEGSFERGFLIAHVKREIARSQHLLGLLRNEPEETPEGLPEEIWAVRDRLVDLAGQLRNSTDFPF